MKKINSFLLLGFCILLSSAGSFAWAGQGTWPEEYRQKITTRVYNESYDKAYDAVIRFCQNNSYPLVSEKKDLGIIFTDAIEGGPVLMGRERLEFNIIKVDQGSTKIELYIHYVSTTGNNIDNFIDEDEYQDLFDKLAKEVTKEGEIKEDTQDIKEENNTNREDEPDDIGDESAVHNAPRQPLK